MVKYFFWKSRFWLYTVLIMYDLFVDMPNKSITKQIISQEGVEFLLNINTLLKFNFF